MSKMLHIRLLGGFGLRHGNTPLTSVRGMRLQSLLAFLVLHADVAHHRQYLAFMLWPDSSEEQARTNLRKLLLQLRMALPDADDYLEADHMTIQWKKEAPYELDVDVLCGLLKSVGGDGTSREVRVKELLVEIVERYSGVLLPGCYEEWMLQVRQQIHDDVVRAIYRLIGLLESQQAYGEAIRYAQQLLYFDPLQESVYQRLMRLHVLNSDRASALRVYHECVAMLQQELGVEPSVGTRRMVENLLRNGLSPVRPGFQAGLDLHEDVVENGVSGKGLTESRVEVCAVEMVYLSGAIPAARHANRPLHRNVFEIVNAGATQEPTELAWVVLVGGRPHRIVVADAQDDLRWMVNAGTPLVVQKVR